MEQYNYKNKNYKRVENLTHDQITKLLKDVHDEYKDDFFGFEDMVNKYSTDDFYKYHYVAKAYLEMEVWISN